MNKLRFPPDLFEEGFTGGIAGDGSVELENPFVNPSVQSCSHSGNSVSTRRSWSPTACVCFGLVFGCLHAREHQKNEVVGFTIVFSPILDEI